MNPVAGNKIKRSGQHDKFSLKGIKECVRGCDPNISHMSACQL